MAALFANGLAVDIVLAVLLVEAVILLRRGAPARPLLLALLPGALILLALRAALGGWGWPLIALFLTLSLPVHLADLAQRGLLRARR
jgi:hypothetical protein